MGLPRFYLPPSELKESRVTLGPETLDHLKARRIRKGQKISLFDACGGEAVALVTGFDRKCAQAEVLERPNPGPDSLPRTALGLGLCRWERLRMAVEKATELGASEIRPILSQRSQPLGRGLKQKMERVVIESLKQCYRSIGPGIREPAALNRVLEHGAGFDLKLIMDREGRMLNSLDITAPRSILVLVGPEGGFDQAERQAALDSGFRPVRISRAVLRTETAVLAGLALVKALWEQPFSTEKEDSGNN